jgi:hypothetical protein
VKVSLTTSTIGAPGRGARVCRSWCFNIDTTVDIRSITASSHPSRRVQEVEGEATSRPRARRPLRVSGHAAATATAATAAATQRQRSTTTVVTPPPAAGPEATLVTTRALLNNPPGSDASSKAAEQWRINVDQLIIAVINTPSPRRQSIHRSGGAPEPSHAHSSSSPDMHAEGRLWACSEPGHDRPQGRARPPPLRRRRSHHHRALAREALQP